MQHREVSKIATVITALLVCVFSGGCIVRPAAETVLSLKYEKNGESTVRDVGFRYAYWAECEGTITVAGYGWHPREAETYAFFWVEPYPATLDRYFVMTIDKGRDKRQCELSFLLHSGLFCGAYGPIDWDSRLLFLGHTVCEPKEFVGKLYIDLKQKKLPQTNDSGNLSISGQIEARHSDEKMRKLVSIFQDEFHLSSN